MTWQRSAKSSSRSTISRPIRRNSRRQNFPLLGTCSRRWQRIRHSRWSGRQFLSIAAQSKLGQRSGSLKRNWGCKVSTETLPPDRSHDLHGVERRLAQGSSSAHQVLFHNLSTGLSTESSPLT